MKSTIMLLCFLPILSFAQIFGKKLDNYKAPNGKTYKVGDTIKLAQGTGLNGDFKYITFSDFTPGLNPSDKIPNGIPAKYARTTAIIKKIKSVKASNGVRVIFAIQLNKEFINYSLYIDDAVANCEIVDCDPNYKPTVPAIASVQSASPAQGNTSRRRFGRPSNTITDYVSITLPDGSPGCRFKLDGVDKAYKLIYSYTSLDTNQVTVNKINDYIKDSEESDSQVTGNFTGIDVATGKECILIAKWPNGMKRNDPPILVVPPTNGMWLKGRYPYWDYFLNHKVGIMYSTTGKNYNENTLLKGVTNIVIKNSDGGVKIVVCKLNGVSKTYKIYPLYTTTDTSRSTPGLIADVVNGLNSLPTLPFGQYLGVNTINQNDCVFIYVRDSGFPQDTGIGQLTPEPRDYFRAVWPFYDRYEVFVTHAANSKN